MNNFKKLIKEALTPHYLRESVNENEGIYRVYMNSDPDEPKEIDYTRYFGDGTKAEMIKQAKKWVYGKDPYNQYGDPILVVVTHEDDIDDVAFTNISVNEDFTHSSLVITDQSQISGLDDSELLDLLNKVSYEYTPELKDSSRIISQEIEDRDLTNKIHYVDNEKYEFMESVDEGFRDPEDNYGFGNVEYGIDDYEIGDQVVVSNSLTTDPLNKQGENGVVTKIDIENEIVNVTFKDRKTGRYYPGAVVFPGDEGKVEYDDDFTDEDYDKWDAKNLESINEDIQPLAVEELTDEALLDMLNNIDDMSRDKKGGTYDMSGRKMTRAQYDLAKSVEAEVRRRNLDLSLDIDDSYESINEGKYRVEFTTQDGEKAKSRVYNSKEEAEKKESALVNISGIKQAKIVVVDESVNEGFEWYQPLLALGGAVGLMATALFAIIGPSTLVGGAPFGGDSWGDVFRHYKKKFSDKKAAENLKKEDVQELINLIQTNIDTSGLKSGVKRYMKSLMNELENEMNKDEEEIDKNKLLVLLRNVQNYAKRNQVDVNESNQDQFKSAVKAYDKAESEGDIRGMELALAAMDLLKGESVNEAKNIRIVLTGDEVNEVDFYEKHSRFFDGPNVEDYLIIPQGKNEIDCKPNKLKSCEAYLKKNNIEYKIQESVNEAKTESELKDAWREWNKKHPKDQIDWGEYREEHGEHLDEGIKDTIKRLFKAAKKKLGMSSLVQATDEEFEYARDHGLKKYPGYSLSGIGVDEIQDIIHVAYMDVDEDGDEIEIELPIPKNLNEDIVDDKAKMYWLQKFKSGEIDTLPDNPRMEYLRHAMRDQLAQDKEQLSRERGLEESINEVESGDIVSYEGEDHTVMRIADDDLGIRIYIRPNEEAVFGGKKDTFWVKPEDLEMTPEEEHEHVKNLLKRNFMDEELTSLTPNEIGDESKQNTSASGAYESKEFNFKSMIKEALKYKHLR